MLFVEREISRNDLLFLEGEAGGGAGRGKHHLADAGLDGRFEDMDGADHIDVEQLRRRRPSRSWHGCQMDNGVLIFARLSKLAGVHDVALDEACPVHSGGSAAEAGHGMTGQEQFSQDISADCTAAAGYEDFHKRMPFKLCKPHKVSGDLVLVPFYFRNFLRQLHSRFWEFDGLKAILYHGTP